MLKNAHLLSFLTLRRRSVPASTPHCSEFREPCIWAFLRHPGREHFFKNLIDLNSADTAVTEGLQSRFEYVFIFDAFICYI